MCAVTAIICVVHILFATINANQAPQCTGNQNTFPINENDLVLVSQVPNGKLYRTTKIDPPINVLHLWGTSYEMGYAHGLIVKPYVDALINQTYTFLQQQIDAAIQFLPKEIRDFIETYGLDAALEATYYLTYEYTPKYFYDELRGIADASGFKFQQLVNIHMLPELIQASCTMVGAWGSATSSYSKDPNTLYQLRALDWITNGPFQQWPAVIVYHPNPGNGHPFAILSFTGFIGAITGYSSKQVGICEKVWLSYNGTKSRSGYPWHFLLRDILQYDNNVNDAITRVVNAHRTCSIFVGVGDPVNKFRAIEYSYEYTKIFNDMNYPEYSGHPRMDGVVYINKHKQPSQEPCLGDLLSAQYGSINSEYLIQVAALHQTGDTHAAVYDYVNNTVYAVIASPFSGGKYTPAYERQWTKFNMSTLFNEESPSLE